MKLKFGFSTGSLHKELATKEALLYLKSLGIKVIELGLVKMDRILAGWIDTITKDDLSGLDYVSLHAPIIEYGRNPETKFVFEKINKINNLRRLDLVIFHPDTIRDFSVFNGLNFPVGFENMDSRKKTCKVPADINAILKDNNHGLVLDVNHIYTNDRTMSLAKEFYRDFEDKIKEIHLSGYINGHQPLFQTKQTQILRSIKYFSIPIIDESVINSKDIERERDYILSEIEKISSDAKQGKY